MAFRPLRDRVLIRRLEGWESRSGKVQLVESGRQRPWHGEVVAAGQGWKSGSGQRKPLFVKAGDRVLVSKSAAGDEVRLEGQRLVILREDEILGVIV